MFVVHFFFLFSVLQHSQNLIPFSAPPATKILPCNLQINALTLEIPPFLPCNISILPYKSLTCNLSILPLQITALQRKTSVEIVKVCYTNLEFVFYLRLVRLANFCSFFCCFSTHCSCFCFFLLYF